MQITDHSHLTWEELDSSTLLSAKVFSIAKSRRRAEDGAETDYYLINSPDWCNVVAPVVRDDGVQCFVMARQFRHGTQTVTLEFPGGIVDPGESPEQAGMRELREETGYMAESLLHIGTMSPNPALMTNLAHTFVAVNARAAGAQALDGNERLDAELIPRSDILENPRPDFHVHSIMLAALLWYERYLKDGLSYEERYTKTKAPE